MLYLWGWVVSLLDQTTPSATLDVFLLITGTCILWQRCIGTRLGAGAAVGRFTLHYYVWKCQKGHCIHVNIKTSGKFMVGVACIRGHYSLVGVVCGYSSCVKLVTQLASRIFPFLSISIFVHFCYLAFPYLLISTLSLFKDQAWRIVVLSKI